LWVSFKPVPNTTNKYNDQEMLIPPPPPIFDFIFVKHH
jgi:hypothetical protein